MFDKLIKLANELDSLGMFEDANYIDEMLHDYIKSEDEKTKVRKEADLLRKENEE